MLIPVSRLRWGDIRTFPRLTVEASPTGFQLWKNAIEEAGLVELEAGVVTRLSVRPEHRGGHPHRALLALAAARALSRGYEFLRVEEEHVKGLDLT